MVYAGLCIYLCEWCWKELITEVVMKRPTSAMWLSETAGRDVTATGLCSERGRGRGRRQGAGGRRQGAGGRGQGWPVQATGQCVSNLHPNRMANPYLQHNSSIAVENVIVIVVWTRTITNTSWWIHSGLDSDTVLVLIKSWSTGFFIVHMGKSSNWDTNLLPSQTSCVKLLTSCLI